MECHNTLFGPFGMGLVDVKMRAYESILEVINNKTEKKGYESIDYYEAARIAHRESEFMQKYIDSETIKIDKGFRPIWEFTYKIVNEEKERVKVVNQDADNLLVSWVPGGMTLTEILKANMI
jgi:hypothetical protein